MPSVLLEDDQHCDVSLLGVVLVDGADDAADESGAEVGHDREFRPIFEEIVVSKDGVRLCEFGPENLCDPGQFFFFGKSHQLYLFG